MRQRLEALDTFEMISNTGNGIELLAQIKRMAFNFQSQKYLPHPLHKSKRRFYMCYRVCYYPGLFGTVPERCSVSGGEVALDPGVVKSILEERNVEMADLTQEERVELEKEAREKYLAVAFILGADRSRFGRLVENSYVQGQNTYPTTVTSAYHLLTNWKQDLRNFMRSGGAVNDGASFTNVHEDNDGELEAVLANSGQTPKQGQGHTRQVAHHVPQMWQAGTLRQPM